MPPKTDASEDGTSSDSEVGASAVNALSPLKIPPFWDEACDVWFITIETQFSLHRTIDDEAKYAHVLGALPQNIIRTVVDIIRNPPRGTKYDTLKAALIKRHTISAEQRLDELLSGFQTMGDHGPSQFYRLLEQKAGGSTLVSDDLLKNLWLKRLPETLRAAVAGFSDKPIIDLLPIADQIWVFAQPSSSQIAESSRHPSTSKATHGGQSDLALLQKQVQDLQRMISDMNINRRRSPTRPNNFNNNFNQNSNFRRNRSRSRSRSRSGFCYFHQRFGRRARTCEQPCTYRSGASRDGASTNFKPSEN